MLHALFMCTQYYSPNMLPNFGFGVCGGGIKFIRAFFDNTSNAGLFGKLISSLVLVFLRFRFLWTLSIASLISFSLSLCTRTACPDGKIITSAPKMKTNYNFPKVFNNIIIPSKLFAGTDTFGVRTKQ